MPRVLRVAVSIWLGFLTGLSILCVASLVRGHGPQAGDQLTQTIFGIAWLLALASLPCVVFWYGWVLLRRRHLGEMKISDATAEPLPMRPNEAALARRLEALGFHHMGETEVRPRFDAPLRTWVFTNQDGGIRAGISRGRNEVTFSSSWADGATLVTKSSPDRTATLPHYRCQSTNGVEAALSLHMQTAPSYGAGHGPVALIQSMTEAVAEIRRRQGLVTPEIMALPLIRGHLVMSILIAAMVVDIVILWPF